MDDKTDEEFKFDKHFPPEYAHVERVIAEMREQLRAFDKRIEPFKAEADPSNYASPKEWRQAEKERRSMLSSLEEVRAIMCRSSREWVSYEVEEEPDPRIAQWVRQSASFDLEPLPGNDPNYLAWKKTIPDLDVHFPEGPAIDVPNEEDKPIASFSSRFSQGLSYTRATEKSSPSTGKETKQGIEPEKD